LILWILGQSIHTQIIEKYSLSFNFNRTRTREAGGAKRHVNYKKREDIKGKQVKQRAAAKVSEYRNRQSANTEIIELQSSQSFNVKNLRSIYSSPMKLPVWIDTWIRIKWDSIERVLPVRTIHLLALHCTVKVACANELVPPTLP
jgi:hypothetical protein